MRFCRLKYFTIAFTLCLFCTGLLAQPAGQRTFSYGGRIYESQQTVALPEPAGGFIIFSNYRNNFALETANDTPNLVILRLNAVLDTLWSKELKDFVFKKAALIDDTAVIVLGARNVPYDFINSEFQLLELRFNGGISKQKTFRYSLADVNQDVRLPAQSVNFTILNSNNIFVLISDKFEASSDFNLWQCFIQLNRNLDIKRTNEMIVPDVTLFQFLFIAPYTFNVQAIDSSKFVIYAGSPGFINLTDPRFKKNLLVIDQNYNVVLNKRITDDNVNIEEVFPHSSPDSLIVACKRRKGETEKLVFFTISLDGKNTFATKEFLSPFKKERNAGRVAFQKSDGNIYAVTYPLRDDYPTVNRIIDEGSVDFRLRVLKLDEQFNKMWAKRVHTFGFNSVLPGDYFTNFFTQPLTSKIELNQVGSKLYVTGNKFTEPGTSIASPPDQLKKEAGIWITGIESNGADPLCKVTPDDFLEETGTITLEDMPAISFGTANVQVFNAAISPVAFPANIADTCLSQKKPESNFFFIAADGNISTNDIFCPGSPVSIEEFSYNEPREWKWIFPSGRRINQVDSSNYPNLKNIIFDTPGRYEIKLVTVNAAGTDTLTKTVVVPEDFAAPALGSDTVLCEGGQLKLIYRNSPGITHVFSSPEWPDIFSTADTLVADREGTYVCSVTNGCETKSDTIVIGYNRNFVTAAFNLKSSCGTDAVFENSSLNNFNGQLNYQWSYRPLNGGSSFIDFSTGENPVFKFPAIDSFVVRLIVSNPLACVASDTIIKIVATSPKPSVSFTYDAICGSKTVSFFTSSNLKVYNWNFNNEGDAAVQNPLFSFTGFGEKEVQLTVTDSSDCKSDTFRLLVTVRDKPVATISASADSICSNGTFRLTAVASVTPGSISAYTWLLDGVPLGNNAVISQSKNGPAVYRYALIATSSQGCESDTAFKTIVVVGKPTASFSFANNCGSLSVPFVSSQSVINDIVTSHYWSFGDGTFSSAINPVKTYSTFLNSYTVSYVAISSIGCSSDTIRLPVVVREKPAASLSLVSPACDGVPFLINAVNSIGNDLIATHYWLINGVPVNINNSGLSLTRPSGDYRIKYVSTSSAGCSSDTALLNVLIEENPSVTFSADSSCAGKPITITNSSLGAVNRYVWQWGNGDSSTGVQPVYKYNNPGNYTIKLTAFSPNGCSAFATNPVNVAAPPVADFSITKSCIGEPLVIRNSSTGGSTYAWELNTGSSFTGPNPFVVINETGSFRLRLTVSSNTGCSSSKENDFTIVPPQLTINADTTIYVNQPLQLFASGAAQYQWQPAPLLNTAAGFNPVFTSSQPGDFKVNVEGTTAQGCKAFDSLVVKVLNAKPRLLPNAFSPNQDNLNDRFRLNCAGLQQLNYLRIYNRYGQIIYEQRNCGDPGWDGKYKGRAQNTGAYVYLWQAVNFNGAVLNGKGTVMLIR